MQSGEVDAGILLHEGQVLYKGWGLKKIIDLGEKWFNHTGLPIPLGLDVINRKFDDDLSSSIAKALKKSIEYAHANEDKALEYALSYGRGISKENGRKFVRMYVNADTVNMGKEGEAALKRLFSLAFDKGIIDFIFLHIGIFHIFTNLIGLLIIGRIVENFFGTIGYVVVYFLTGIIGNICSFYFSPNIGAGASGAIFGLFGTYIAYLLINRSYLGRVGKDMLLSVLFIVLINIFFGLFSNGIDNTAHFCGLISGLIIGFYIIPNLKNYRFRWVGNSKVSFFYSQLFRYLLCIFVTYVFAVIIVNIKSNSGY